MVLTMLDDIPGIVIEAGSTWTRFGFAGDAAPRYIVQSAYAKDQDGSITYDNIETNVPGREIYTPVMDGIIHDWDACVGLWQQLADKSGYALSDQPLLLLEEPWNPVANRQRALEAAFDTLQVPLFSLAKAPLATTIESSRTSAIVVDIGSATASVAPVLDGAIVAKAVTHTRFAGDFLDAHLQAYFLQRNIEAIPEYRVKTRVSDLEPGQPSDAVLSAEGTASYNQYQLARLMLQFKQFASQVSPAPFVSGLDRGTRPFEFPTGYNLLFGAERMATVEPLFKPTVVPLPGTPIPENSLGLSELIYQSVNKVEAPPEVIINLVSNVILTGGTSALRGLARRVENDLLQMLPNYTARFHLPKANAAWAGGSILASFAHSDPSWITKAEYDEVGAEQLVEKRFR